LDRRPGVAPRAVPDRGRPALGVPGERRRGGQ
jgi:hypothetical protein